MLGIGSASGASSTPLYVTLLQSYLCHFAPVGMSLGDKGLLLLELLAEFWLCQNCHPLKLKQLPRTQPFQDTRASVLGCLEYLFAHLNAHEASRIATSPMAPSAHAMFMVPMYHFFDKQLNNLPDRSKRVQSLIKSMVLYLRPWGAERAATKEGDAGSSPRARAAQTSDAEALPAMSAAEVARWPWADFVRRNALLYVRLLTSVARELKANRFDLSDKKDLEMLQAVAALFDSRQVLAIVRTMCEALDQFLGRALPGQSATPRYLDEGRHLEQQVRSVNGQLAPGTLGRGCASAVRAQRIRTPARQLHTGRTPDAHQPPAVALYYLPPCLCAISSRRGRPGSFAPSRATTLLFGGWRVRPTYLLGCTRSSTMRTSTSWRRWTR